MPKFRNLCMRVEFQSTRRLVAALMFSAALSIAAPVHANFSCYGPVSYLAVNSGGAVYASTNGYGVWTICQVNGAFTSGGTTIPQDVCKAWYAGLTAAKHGGASITMYFESTATGSNNASCTALGSWTISIPYHIEFL